MFSGFVMISIILSGIYFNPPEGVGRTSALGIVNPKLTDKDKIIFTICFATLVTEELIVIVRDLVTVINLTAVADIENVIDCVLEMNPL